MDTPILDEGSRIEDFPEFKLPSENIVGALDALTKFLKRDPSADSTIYV